MESDIIELSEKLQADISEITIDSTINTSYNTNSLLAAHQKRTELIQSGKIKKIELYLSELREILGYFGEDDLKIIAGRPSMGKTALMLNFVNDMLMNYDLSVGIISLEMSAISLLNRMVAMNLGISTSKMKNDILTENEYKKIKGYFNILQDRKLFIEDQGGLTERQIYSIARRWKTFNKIDILFIDHLQCIKCTSSQLNAEQMTAKITQEMKNIAKALDIPVVCLCQLSRASMQRTDKMPSLSDLRYSGAIEQIADTVVFTHIPYKAGIYKFPDGTDTEGIANLIVAKQRDGATGIIRTAFVGDRKSTRLNSSHIPLSRMPSSA